MMRFQSLQKKKNSTSAVARCVSTRNDTKNGSLWSIFQPNNAGSMTLCPRLETGKSSVMPCSAPRMTDWKTLMCPEV